MMVNTDEKSELMNVINSLRIRMVTSGMIEGFTSQSTLKLSQELDKYIVKYQTY